MSWWKDLRGKISLNEPLKIHTTFRIGGPTRFFIEPKDINDLKLLLNLLKRYKIPFLVIGAGSNILVSDEGLDVAVIHLNSSYFKKFFFENNYLRIGSGAMLSQVVLLAQRRDLSGPEFLVGIPGTVGGALVMNAGILEKVKSQKSKAKNIGDLVENVTVMDFGGNVKTLNKKEIKFQYRKSNLSKYIILNARIKLIKKNKQEIKDKINRYLNFRRMTQDLSLPSAGCIFKNPKGDSAGRLIDLCGLKGRKIGDARISLKHANFILNLGNTNAKDVFKLVDLMRKEVKNKFNITLEPEIKIWQ